MKRLNAFLFTLLTACAISAQVSTENYLLSRRMLNEASTSYVDNIQYYDGLGRPFQHVEKGVLTGSVKERLGSLQEYDYYGRKAKSWLPIPLTADYLDATTFKSTAQGSGAYGDTRPYVQPVYEASPLDRALQQYGSGAVWYSNGRSVKTEYLSNTASSPLNCLKYTVSSTGSLTAGGTYTAGLLNVTKTTDEDNKVSYVFTDKLGRMVLERRMDGTTIFDTYHVYDDANHLRFVLQPMYQTTADLDLYAFQYKYDGHGNCIWKKLPGAEHVLYEYDSNDRLVFSQDGNQRSAGKWTFYVYDSQNRLVQQGENTSKAVAASGVYIQNHYDGYDFLGTTGFPTATYTSGNTYGKGSLTGTVTNVLGSTTDKIYTAYYYDIKGRVTKEIRNNLLGGYDITSTTYTFTDKPSTVTHTHMASGKTTRTEVYTYTYDHYDRLITVKHKLGSTEITLASYTYDSFGRPSTKNLHGSNTQTFTYNIRNWTTGISSGKFTQNLVYNDGTNGFNGNITGMSWTANGESHSYSFAYDGLNRLIDATHGAGNFSEKVTGYDKNGNITGLQRYGRTGAGAYDLVDNLTYTLNGNQITKVEDAVTTAAYSTNTAFTNGASAANEYTYDDNGNLTKDSNKGITNITYNCLNLPSVVTFSSGNTITYTYAADGSKLRTVHKIGTTTTTTDYCGNVIYESGVQKRLLTEEGYVDLSVTTPVYYYYLKDHQGNNRVVINSSGTVQETNHYYPFGGTFTASSVQPYKYNGKELDTKAGLNWYDYGARHYDAVLGRWHTMDPLAEKMYSWSPYAYCFNNPTKFVDKDGKIGQVAIGALVGGVIGGGYAIWQGKSLNEIAAATIGGAIDGAITATGIGLIGKVATGIVGAGTGNIVEQGINVISGNQSNVDGLEMATSTLLGALGGNLSHQIDKVTSGMIKAIDQKYTMSSVKKAIVKEVKSEITATGQKIGSSTKKTINDMSKQRIEVLSNTEKIAVKGTANGLDWGIGVVNTSLNTEITKWNDEKDK